MTTGDRMRIRRKELGISVDEIASALGVSVATVYRYENGEIEKVPGTTLEPLAAILRTTPAYLMGWDDAPAPAEQHDILDEIDVAFYGDYKELTEENKATLRDMARIMRERQANK